MRVMIMLAALMLSAGPGRHNAAAVLQGLLKI